MNTKTKLVVHLVLFALLLGSLGMISCAPKGSVEQTKSDQGKISYYTCPMHPHIHEDEPGECPICHMSLVPVYEQGQPNADNASSLQIPPERQQLIGVRTSIVERKPAIKVLKTVGRVAFDPELAIAQKEFVEIAKRVPSLRTAAISRLKLLGMSDEEIQLLEQTGRISTTLYLPSKGGAVWIYATLYQAEMGLVKAGMKAEITLTSGSKSIFVGTVRAIDPVIDPLTRSAHARIEVSGAGGELRPDTFVNVQLHVDLGEALVIPKSAVIDTGTRQVAFVVQGDRNFEPRDLQLGAETDDGRVVLDGLHEQERVVSSATFLVDSESQLKAAILGMVESPTCPEGEYWDVGMAMCMPKVGDGHD